MKPTTQTILISVIIPAFNCEATIGRCLQSLIDQTLFKNLEILVIDDGSTDRTCEIVESFAIQNTEIHLVKQTNSGPAAARNRGLDRARGEFFSFVDSDDYVDIDYFLEAFRVFLATKFRSQKPNSFGPPIHRFWTHGC